MKAHLREHLSSVRHVSAEIRHDSAIPVYRQIASLLEQEISSGKLAPGSRIPSESRLVQEYGVSRDTARKAIAVLRESDYIVTTPGKGSYVAEARQATSRQKRSG